MKPIKVLHIITRLILGGAQENTVLTVEGLRKRRGYEVALATGPPRGAGKGAVKGQQCVDNTIFSW